MCYSCVEDATAGKDVPVTDTMTATSVLIVELYGMHGCGCGGPLHIVTDDYNLGPESLAFCRDWLAEPSEHGYEHGYAPEVVSVASRILDAMDGMTEAERAVTIWNAHG